MPCTTILVGKKASYDGSTMIARNDDSGAGNYMPKKFQITDPEKQMKSYQSVISKVEITLPENPMRYSCVPNAVDGEGIWAAAGVNEVHVSMTATETIANNPRVLGADPLVSNGIGEEDIVYLVLPYIRSAREGVKRLGELLENYGTYEMNGLAFQDSNEIWWMETIGGHHWMARRVPDDVYVVMPNQLGLDRLDLTDALGEQKEYMCSTDLNEFIRRNHLNLSMEEQSDFIVNPRELFGTHDDADHVYNTPRAWYMLRYLNPKSKVWDGANAEYTPMSDDLPWCMTPEKKITLEDIKYLLSSHFQGTPYDPYLTYGDKTLSGAYRSIGVNRTDFMSLIQSRPVPEYPEDSAVIQWIAFGSNAFNVMVPMYSETEVAPTYLASTTGEVSTDSFYWVSRLIGAMADASYGSSLVYVERYQEQFMAKCHAHLKKYDKLLAEEPDSGKRMQIKRNANQEITDILKTDSADVLGKVLKQLSNQMRNGYSRSDS